MTIYRPSDDRDIIYPDKLHWKASSLNTARLLALNRHVSSKLKPLDNDSEAVSKCDSRLYQACRPLLVQLSIWERLCATNHNFYMKLKLLQIQAGQHITYNVLRVRKGTATFENPIRSADLIPIRVIEGKATLSWQPLVPGWRTHITGYVDVSSAPEFLAIVYH